MKDSGDIVLLATMAIVIFALGVGIGHAIGLARPKTCHMPDVLTVESGDGQKTARCVDGRGEVVR